MIYYFDLHRTRVFGPMFRKSGVVQRNHFRSFLALYAIRIWPLGKLPSVLFYPEPKFIEGDDMIIVFDTYASARMINWLCRNWPDKRLILWYWNAANNLGIRKLVPDRVEFWSYSEKDCERYGFRYNTQFFFDCLAGEAQQCRSQVRKKPTMKAFFIGRDKGRSKVLGELAERLREAGVEVDLQIRQTKTGRLHTLRESLFSYRTVIDMVKDADILLDYGLDPDTGMSMRPLEALFFGKKLITNNKGILDADFYSPANIYVLDHDVRTLKEFVECPGVEVAPEIRDRYLLSYWLKRFDG